MNTRSLLPLNTLIMLGAVIATGLVISTLTGVGLYGREHAGNPFEIFANLITYGFPYLGLLVLGGLLFLVVLAATPRPSRSTAFLIGPVAALPALVLALAGSQPTPAQFHAPVVFALIVAIAVRVPLSPDSGPHTQ